MIRAKLDLKNLEISFGDREFGLGFRDLSGFEEVMFRLKRLPEMFRKGKNQLISLNCLYLASI
jgi:hypothetical protein